ncbi:MAG TPA: WG repeat-containing protein [Sideroxyarcus sp.]|nr:WG repeat-containing protein [Sideroxyarcus sp.]
MKPRSLLPAALLLLSLCLSQAHAATFNVVGALNADGLAIPFREEMTPPQAGLHLTVGDGRVGVTDEQGNWVLQPQYGFVMVLDENRFMVWQGMQYSLPMAGAAGHPINTFYLKNPLYIVDHSGNKVADAPPFALELKNISTTKIPYLYEFTAERDGKKYYGVMTHDLRVVAQDEMFGSFDITDRHIILGKLVDEYGKTYRSVSRVYDHQGNLISDVPHIGNHAKGDSGFHNGLAVSYDPEKKRMGFIDTAGNWVIEPKYFAAHPFYDEVAVVITSQDDPYEQEAILIDRNGKKVTSLPDGRCFTQAENGRVFVQVEADKKDYGYLLDYTGKKIAKLPKVYCSDTNRRLKWIDDKHFALSSVFNENAVFNANGEKVLFGNYPFAYSTVMYTDRKKGLLYVRGYEDSPRSLAQLKQMEQEFYDNVALRPVGNADWSTLQEPDFHVYQVTRLYADESWQPGNSLDYHLVTLSVEVKMRDGRSMRDPQFVLATAGCMPRPGMKFIAAGVLTPDDPKKNDFVEYETFAEFLEDKTGKEYVSASPREIPCNTKRLIDGPVPRPAVAKP